MQPDNKRKSKLIENIRRNIYNEIKNWIIEDVKLSQHMVTVKYTE